MDTGPKGGEYSNNALNENTTPNEGSAMTTVQNSMHRIARMQQEMVQPGIVGNLTSIIFATLEAINREIGKTVDPTYLHTNADKHRRPPCCSLIWGSLRLTPIITHASTHTSPMYVSFSI